MTYREDESRIRDYRPSAREARRWFGRDYVARQLKKKGIAFEQVDNALFS